MSAKVEEGNLVEIDACTGNVAANEEAAEGGHNELLRCFPRISFSTLKKNSNQDLRGFCWENKMIFLN